MHHHRNNLSYYTSSSVLHIVFASFTTVTKRFVVLVPSNTPSLHVLDLTVRSDFSPHSVISPVRFIGHYHLSVIKMSICGFGY